MKSDLNVDCPLSFSILVEDEIAKYGFITDGIKERIIDLCEIVFKAGFKAGQLPENNIRFKEISR